uniref:Uncharacterized protein n=1 Tax=Prorocentrum micans TaxID=2945 RepID=A0A7S2TCE6_PROMC
MPLRSDGVRSHFGSSFGSSNFGEDSWLLFAAAAMVSTWGKAVAQAAKKFPKDSYEKSREAKVIYRQLLKKQKKGAPAMKSAPAMKKATAMKSAMKSAMKKK